MGQNTLQDRAEQLLREQDETLRQEGCLYQCHTHTGGLFQAAALYRGKKWQLVSMSERTAADAVSYDRVFVHGAAHANCIGTALWLAGLLPEERAVVDGRGLLTSDHSDFATVHEFLETLIREGVLKKVD